MTYLVDTWGGNDNSGGSYGTYDIYSNTSGEYPAARVASNGTFPVWITNVGAYLSGTGTSSAANATGYFKLGTVTTNGFTGVSNTGTTFVNASLKYDGVNNGGALVYSGSTASPQKLTFVNTSTWGVWAGRNTDAAYTTVYGTTSRSGRMGGSVTYYLVPSAPTAVNATASTSSAGVIELDWTVPAEDGGSGTNGTASSEINAYSIYRSTSANGTYTLVEKVAASSVVSMDYAYGYYSDTSAKSANTTYYYKVAAHNRVTDQMGPSIAGTLSAASSVVYAPQVPNTPTISSATASNTNAGTITISYSATVTSGSAAVSSYDIYRDGTKLNSSPVTTTSYTDSTGVVGNSYTYTVVAKNSIGSSSSSTGSTVRAPGAPAAPSSISISKVARNVTVTVGDSSDNYGKAISGYYVQYQSSTTENGTYSSWSTPVLMTNKEYAYLLLEPAKWYKFRSYAKNSIIKDSSGSTIYYPDTGYSSANFVVYDTPLFVTAGGKRLRSSGETNAGTFQPTETVKRFDGLVWVDVQKAKKYDPTNPNAVNGWVDLS